MENDYSRASVHNYNPIIDGLEAVGSTWLVGECGRFKGIELGMPGLGRQGNCNQAMSAEKEKHKNKIESILFSFKFSHPIS